MFAQDFAGRCLPFDAASAVNYASVVSGRHKAGLTITTEDAQIAAIALTHGYPFAAQYQGLSAHRLPHPSQSLADLMSGPGGPVKSRT